MGVYDYRLPWQLGFVVLVRFRAPLLNLLSNSLIEAVRMNGLKWELNPFDEYLVLKKSSKWTIWYGNDRFRLASTNGPRASWNGFSTIQKIRKSLQVLLVIQRKLQRISSIHWKNSTESSYWGNGSVFIHIKLVRIVRFEDDSCNHCLKSTCGLIRTPRPTG